MFAGSRIVFASIISTFTLLPDILSKGGAMMRYIYYIIFIFMVLSAIIGYALKGNRDTTKEAAIIINDRVITTEEFKKLSSSQPLHMMEMTDFINSVITKELLLQESKREGIDREEPFRRSIQNFYEQSLIKLLMDRKFSSLQITPDEDALNRYLASLNKKYHVTIFSFDSPEDARKSKFSDGKSRSISFVDLSRDIRDHILVLKPGRMTEPLKTGEKYVVIRLDRLETLPGQVTSDTEREKIRQMLIEEKKEQVINDWIADLRKKSSVKVFVDREK
jgi:hypothetical protein